MFIDSTYFTAERSLLKSEPEDLANLNMYIEKYEKQYLIYALGIELYNEFIAGLAETLPAQKWIDLRDGKEYMYTAPDGTQKKGFWHGLKNASKESFLADFVYYEIVLKHGFQFTSNFTQNNAENSTVVNPWAYLCTIYNKGLETFGKVPFDANGFDIETPGGYFAGYFNTTNLENWNLESSLFNFLYFANLETIIYDNWVFTGLKRINQVINV